MRRTIAWPSAKLIVYKQSLATGTPAGYLFQQPFLTMLSVLVKAVRLTIAAVRYAITIEKMVALT